jgi:hypothetical protein
VRCTTSGRGVIVVNPGFGKEEVKFFMVDRLCTLKHGLEADGPLQRAKPIIPSQDRVPAQQVTSGTGRRIKALRM